MSFEPPAGILDIGNATLRVGKLEVSETSGLNQGLQNIVKNDLLITEKETYLANKTWGIKLPTAWVGEFDLKTHDNKYVEFNFYNEGSTSNALGYTLNFKDTTLTLKYDNGNTLASETIPDVSTSTYKKVNVFFERGVIAVFIDGARVLYFKESDTYNSVHGHPGMASRVASTTGGSFVNIFIEADGSDSAVKDLRIVNGRFISDKTSNVSFIGSLGVGVNSPKESLDIRGNMHFNRVSNVSQISVDSNVVTEYTGPHDRPLRKYPEVALTQNDESATSGYVASASSPESISSFQAWKAFSAFTSNQNRWQTSPDTYDSNGNWVSGVGATGVQFTDTNGGEHSGEWIKLQLPKSIKLDYIRYLCNYTDFMTKDFVILGSNDDTSWTLLKSVTGGTSIEDVYHTLHINADGYYKYYVWLTTAINGTGGEVLFNDICFYGYEEGSGSLDTTLKTVYNVPATTGTQLEVYYDGQDYGPSVPTSITDKTGNGNNTTTVGSGIGFDSTYKAFTFDGTTNGKIEGTHGLGTGTGIQYSMSLWFKADVLSGNHRLATFGTQGTQYQSSTLLIYQNDIHLDHWLSEIKTTSDILVPNVWYHLVAIHTGPGTEDVSQNALYLNGVKLEDVTTGGSAVNGTFNLQGTGLTIGADSAGTNPFDGSIANFRLYSKALNADQVKELYDYQKDYFLGSKSQVTLYKGHLGVGVTEPSGQLELAGDERIQEYPPRALTGYSTHIEGHGVFTAYGSSQNNRDSKSYSVIGAFDKTISPDSSCWLSDTFYSGGLPTSGAAKINGVSGEWCALQCPYPIKLQSFTTRVRSASSGENSRMAKSGIIWGSNDGATWYQVHSWGGRVYSDGNPNYFEVNSTEYYSHHAFQATEIQGNADATTLGEWRLFGTPGPTTLDKGSLTLGRSLDVPRVSRYDVDTETPRYEKLLIDYDTTVNSSVTDISGNGNHGRFFDNARYSTADKAFEFDGTDDYTQTSIAIAGGNMAWTQSMWFKINAFPATSTHYTVLSFFGNKSGLSGHIMSYRNNEFWQDWYGNGVKANYTLEVGKWYHVVSIYHGNTSTDANVRSSIYINGVKQTLVWYSQTSSPMTLPTSTFYELADYINTSNVRHNGWISNPKFYTVALEPSEVKKLYNLGRTGRSMVISDTAVGIGKTPEAQLDVRGNIAARGAISSNNPGWSYWLTGSPDQNDIIYNSATDGPVTFNSLQSFGQNWETGVAGTSTARGTGRNFEPSTGTYTAPEKGVYLVQFCWSMAGGSGGDDSQYALFVTAGNDDNGGSWESGGSFPNRGTNSSAYMQFNPLFSTRPGIEECWCISDLILLDKGSTVQVWFKNVSSATTLTVNRANFSGIKIA